MFFWFTVYFHDMVEINAFCTGGVPFSANISGERVQFPVTPVAVKDWRYSCFVWFWDIDRQSFLFVTIHASDTRTDGQNCDSNTVRCILCSHMVKIGTCLASLVAKSRSLSRSCCSCSCWRLMYLCFAARFSFSSKSHVSTRKDTSQQSAGASSVYVTTTDDNMYSALTQNAIGKHTQLWRKITEVCRV